MQYFSDSIRQAYPNDYSQVAPLIVQAMEDLACTFANTREVEKTYDLFEHFFRLPANQYSYENTLVYEERNEILGSVTGYDGGLLPIYRKPFMDHIAKHYNVRDLIIENETMEGEFYIDTISIAKAHQGKGIGKRLLKAIQLKAQEEGHERIGLLVDLKNPNAKKLYEALGYTKVGSKRLGNNIYEHLQLVL